MNMSEIQTRGENDMNMTEDKNTINMSEIQSNQIKLGSNTSMIGIPMI